MKKITKELIHKTVSDMQKEALSLQSEIFKLQIERKVKPQKDTNRIKTLQKRRAAILTIIRQKTFAEKSTVKETI